MTNKIILQLDTNQTQHPWVKLDDEGLFIEQGLFSEEKLLQNAQQWQHYELIVIVPGADCLSVEASIPAKSQQQIRAALPYSVEEQLSQPVEQLHFAISPQNEQGQTYAIVVDNERMEQWIKILERAELSPKSIIADYQGLCSLEHHHMLINGRQILVRTPNGHGFSCEPELLDLLLKTPKVGSDDGNETNNSKPKLLIEQASEIDPDLLQQLEKDWQIEQVLIEDALVFLAGSLEQSQPINLLQHRFKRKRKTNKLWKTWGVPAIAASIVVLMQLITWSVDYWQLSHQKMAILNAQKLVYKKAFPAERRINNPARLMRSRLKKSGSNNAQSNFFPLLEKFNEAKTSITLNQLTSLTYRAKNGEMNVNFIAPDLATIEKFQTALRNLNLEVKPGASNAVDSGYSGQMTIKEKS